MSKLRFTCTLLGSLAVGLVGLISCGDEQNGPPASAPAARPAVAVVWLTDIAAAKQQASEKKLPILANFTGSDWCHWCQKLDEEVFNTAIFASWAASHVILLKIDFPRDFE